jgi:uncharacterized OB-fold protein
MTETFAAIPPIAPGIFRADGGMDEPVLLGGRCSACDRSYFPRPGQCPQCLGAIGEVELGSRGRIYSWTVVRTKPPLGLPAPYAVGYVDLDGCGLRIFALLDPGKIHALGIGAAVHLTIKPVDAGGAR